jgi:hypothetical protein
MRNTMEEKDGGSGAYDAWMRLYTLRNALNLSPELPYQTPIL